MTTSLWRFQPATTGRRGNSHDSILSVSGQLNLASRGPACICSVAEVASMKKCRAWIHGKPRLAPDALRRSIYIFSSAAQYVPFLKLSMRPGSSALVSGAETRLRCRRFLMYDSDFVNREAATSQSVFVARLGPIRSGSCKLLSKSRSAARRRRVNETMSKSFCRPPVLRILYRVMPGAAELE